MIGIADLSQRAEKHSFVVILCFFLIMKKEKINNQIITDNFLTIKIVIKSSYTYFIEAYNQVNLISCSLKYYTLYPNFGLNSTFTLVRFFKNVKNKKSTNDKLLLHTTRFF